MATHDDNNYRGLICPAAKSRHLKTQCSNTKICNEKRIVSFLNNYLSRVIDEQSADAFSEIEQSERPEARLTLLNSEIAVIQSQLATLIREQSRAPESIQPHYRAEISNLDEQLRIKQAARLNLQQQASRNEQTIAVQQSAVEKLTRLGIEGFWRQDSRVINQLLHQLMGQSRLIINGGHITRLRSVQRRQRRRD
jgi:hypothetical protein